MFILVGTNQSDRSVGMSKNGWGLFSTEDNARQDNETIYSYLVECAFNFKFFSKAVLCLFLKRNI